MAIATLCDYPKLMDNDCAMATTGGEAATPLCVPLVTAEDLEAIKRLDELARPRPWKHVGCGKVEDAQGGVVGHVSQKSDATFIELARVMLPTLVREIERLHEVVEAQRWLLGARVQPRGIYVASKTRHAARWLALRADGVPIISTWIDEAGEGETSDWRDLWDRCLREAAGAAALVIYVEEGEVHKGSMAEVGAALASGVPVFWVGPEVGTIRRARGVTVCESLEEAIRLATAVAGGADQITDLDCSLAEEVHRRFPDDLSLPIAEVRVRVLRLCREVARGLVGEVADCGFHIGEVDHHGELELVLEVNGARGSAWLSEEMWCRMGEVAGWSAPSAVSVTGQDAVDRLRAVLPNLQAAAEMARLQVPDGTVELGVLAKEASGGGRVTASFRATEFLADLTTVVDPRMAGAGNRPYLILSTKWSKADKNVEGHLVWWGPNHSGYTPAIDGPHGEGLSLAGRYSAEEARRIVAGGDGTAAVRYEDAIALSFRIVPADEGKVRRLVDAGQAALREQPVPPVRKPITELDCLMAIDRARALCRAVVARARACRDAGEPHTVPPLEIRRMANLNSEERTAWPPSVPSWLTDAFPYGPCETAFAVMAPFAPGHLIRMVASGALPPHLLTFAAEHVGNATADMMTILETLVPLLTHDHVTVREGALVGLAKHLGPARAQIEKVAAEDPSETIREIARGMLADPDETGDAAAG